MPNIFGRLFRRPDPDPQPLADDDPWLASMARKAASFRDTTIGKFPHHAPQYRREERSE